MAFLCFFFQKVGLRRGLCFFEKIQIAICYVALLCQLFGLAILVSIFKRQNDDYDILI